TCLIHPLSARLTTLPLYTNLFISPAKITDVHKNFRKISTYIPSRFHIKAEPKTVPARNPSRHKEKTPDKPKAAPKGAIYQAAFQPVWVPKTALCTQSPDTEETFRL